MDSTQPIIRLHLGFTWDCALKMTSVKLDLLLDIDMVMFVEQGIRGGLSQVCISKLCKL